MVPQNLRPNPIPTVYPTPEQAIRRIGLVPAPAHRLLLLVALLTATSSCAKDAKPDPSSASEQSVASSAPLAHPGFELRDDTTNLLLTWVDEKGDFLVGEKLDEVPEASKALVRVVITTREEGTGQSVFVADLSRKNPDGTYPLKSITRAEWNEIGASKRKVRMEALAPSLASTANTDLSSPHEGSTNVGVVKAVVYGASWCKPCHDAEALLKKLGVDVTKKDIEQSQAAAAEMQQKLVKAGRGGASIPVIDVAGQLFIGFSPEQLKQAVERARKASK